MTILYEEDWGKYKNPIVDDRTKNRSWVEMAAKYRSMGVKHWYFPLALLQPELRNWDPFDRHLPQEIRLMMLEEMERNPWYYFREVQRVPAKAGGEPGFLLANRGNIATIWCLWNRFITYLQQIRQTGKSLISRSIVTNFHHVTAMNSQHILFTKGDLRKEEIKEYKAMRALLPSWMYYIDKKDADNQVEFTTLARGNRTKSYIPQGDPTAANSVGRGTTPAFVNIDEPPFLDYAEISIPALLAATTAVFDEARRKGAFYGILYSTTAGDLSTRSGEYVYKKIKKQAFFFRELLYDARNRDHAVEIITSGSASKVVPMVDISFNHRQLGYSDEWVQEKIATSAGSRDKAQRDFLNMWTFGSASNPINEKVLNIIRDNANHDYASKEGQYGYTIRLHRDWEYIKGRYTVMGLDLSNAIGRDAITGVLIDVETTETLAAFHVNETNTQRFAQWLVDLVIELPLMTLVPESKNIWIPVLDALLIALPLKGIDPGKRIYSTVVDEARTNPTSEREFRDYSTGAPTERKYSRWRKDFGFSTNAARREMLYVDVLRQATSQSPTLIIDPLLIDELSSLVEKNGRIDHDASGHDDHVISWLLAQWFIRYARNIEHYGLNPKIMMSGLSTAVVTDPVERRKSLKQQKLKNEITRLEQLLETARTVLEKQYYTQKIESLRTDLDAVEDDQPVSSIAKQAFDARQRRVENAIARGYDEGIFRNGIKLRGW